ncbi:ABC transporter permease [Azospirillum sp. TSO22-1]|uniref:ABC transporter permease n=1 Tax=Azospirillum sp. TSO22-1 TaxID=716789 RepID=UPI000D60717B|nr:ABC transporter permease [Azospirillum sp. TSO22-1]PWC42611.1 ABC transporter permease [Azospirillum sp. TSO22-1]
MSAVAASPAPDPPAAPRPRAVPHLLAGPATLLFAALVLTPLILTALLSLNEFEYATGRAHGFTLAHYAAVLGDPYYLEIFLRTFRVAALATGICVVIGVPEAYVLSRMRRPWRSVFLLVVLAPLLVSVVVRAFGWSMLLGPEGPVNDVLAVLGFGKKRMLYSEGTVVVALVHVMLPFMIIPVWTSLQKLDPAVEQAALSFGASRATAVLRVVAPQILPGILSGSLIVFGLSASAFAIPGLLGGRRLKMVATIVYDQYLSDLNWPLGAAVAVILLAANLIVMLTYHRVVEGHYRKRMG